MSQQPNIPVKRTQVLSLSNLGINSKFFKFPNVTISSSHCIIVREDEKIHIINTKTKQITPLKVSVDNAIMNPTSNVLGLRANNNLQIFNLDMKTKMKSIKITEEILFWKWLNSRELAYVTRKAVYHWSMEGNSNPEKRFDIVSEERPVQIINYDASSDGKWLFLQGIAKNPNTNEIEGLLQLYSVEHKSYQPKMNAHGGCFVSIKFRGRNDNSICFCFTKPDQGETKLFIVEVGNEDDSTTHKISTVVPFKRNNDFIVSMIGNGENFGCLYALSKAGFLFLFDIQSGNCVWNRQVSQTVIFLSIEDRESDGVLTLDRNGKVVLFSVDKDNYVPYIMNVLNNKKLGAEIAGKYGLPGAEGLFKKKFKQVVQNGNWTQAIKFASEIKGLRTQEAIQLFAHAPHAPNEAPYDLQYFQLLLQKTTLNKVESVAICRRILHFKPKEGKIRIEKLLKEKKLEFSEELGDVLAPYDARLALTVYYKTEVTQKTVVCFILLGQTDKVIEHSKQNNYKLNWSELLAHVQTIRKDKAKDFAQFCVDKNYLSPNEVINVLLGGGRNDVETTTQFLLDYFKNRGDRKEDKELQTKLLEINLKFAPQVAEAIFESDDYSFTQYDKLLIGRLCESAQLFHRALEHYENLDDIKRVLQIGLGNNALKPEFVISFFGDLTPEDGLSCLSHLLQYSNSGINLQLVVEVCNTYSDKLTKEKLIKLFENFECFHGLYLYLGNMINDTKDSEVIHKYIFAAAELGQIKQIEFICKENNYYDPKQVKTFLLESSKIKDPKALILLCDRHGFISELTEYLYANQLFKFIQVYVESMNPSATPKVVGSLLDLNAPEDEVRNLVSTVRPPQCPIKELVEELESRNRLTLLLPWLENRFHEGLEDPSLHNALAKIYIDINNNPRHYLMTNKFYDSEIVGAYCESRDPSLAFMVYKRALGKCDKQLITVTNKYGYYKDAARYCVERQDADLWALVLNEENEHRQSLIDKVISTALPESRNPDEVSSTVKAFMNADLPNELIELLEKIVLPQSNEYNFRGNKNLQNLLILTAIKADPSRVSGYIDRLDNYDGPELAKICVSDEYKLYEEGFLIFKKFNRGVDAIKILLDNIGDIERGNEFALYLDIAEVWSILGKSQLDSDLISDAISSFLKAEDAQYYQQLIEKANKTDNHLELIKFLLMARDKVRDKTVDMELIYSYAKTEKLSELEQFISNPNTANLDKVGNRCFTDGFYAACKIIFTHIKNFAKLASTLVKLEEFKEAVDAARKANNIQTWKDVCYSCVDSEKFRLAQMCGINIIIFRDHLADLMNKYETDGHFYELMALLGQGINLDRAHEGIYTQLGILLSKYKEKMLMDHIRLFYSRVNIPTLLQACKDQLHWKEAVFLYKHNDEFDNAVETMIAHSTSCWEHENFITTIKKVSSSEILYSAINFYLQYDPLHLSELLIELSHKIDHKRVIKIIDNCGQLALIQSYLFHVQSYNIKEVNEAVNRLLIEDYNYNKLRESINEFNEFDHIELAQKLEKHELLQFRRISAYLNRIKKRYKKSLELSKKDKLWKDTMETVTVSNDVGLAEEILRYFVTNTKCPNSCFAAMLYTCFSLIRCDIVLELAWRYNLKEYSIPFMVQTFKENNQNIQLLNNKINNIQIKTLEKEKFKQELEKKNNIEKAQIFGGMNYNLLAIDYTQQNKLFGNEQQNIYAPQNKQISSS